jgi:hypothetical protein
VSVNHLEHVLVFVAWHQLLIEILACERRPICQFLNDGCGYFGTRVVLGLRDGKQLDGLLRVLKAVLYVVEVLGESQVVEADAFAVFALGPVHIQPVILLHYALLVASHFTRQLALVFVSLSHSAAARPVEIKPAALIPARFDCQFVRGGLTQRGRVVV